MEYVCSWHPINVLQGNPRKHRCLSHHGHVSKYFRDRSATITDRESGSREQLQPAGPLQSKLCPHLLYHLIQSNTGTHLQQHHRLQRQRRRPRAGTNREELQPAGLLQSNLCPHLLYHLIQSNTGKHLQASICGIWKRNCRGTIWERNCGGTSQKTSAKNPKRQQQAGVLREISNVQPE